MIEGFELEYFDGDRVINYWFIVGFGIRYVLGYVLLSFKRVESVICILLEVNLVKK